MARILRKNQKRKTKKRPQIVLSEGIILSGDFCEQREKRWTDYFVRALSLFAIVTGSLGGMLSAFDITYEKWVFFMAALIASLYCASLYFAKWWENIGYVILLAVGILTAYILRQNHYSCRPIKEKAYQKTAKKHVFPGSYSGRAAMGTLFAVALLCTAVIGIAGLLIPKNSFMTAEKEVILSFRQWIQWKICIF